MSFSKYKVGDSVIGVAYPDLIPAKIIEVISVDSANYYFYRIEYIYKGNLKMAIVQEYRIRLNESKNQLELKLK